MSIKNTALKSELKVYLKDKGYKVEEEIIFNKIMDTKRQYRADYLIRSHNIIIEINGGQWTGGRHTRASKVKGKGYTTYENDLNKLNIAQINGFKILQFTYEQLARQEYKELL